MFEGNEKIRNGTSRRSIAIRTVAPASKLSGLALRRLVIRGVTTVVPAMKKQGRAVGMGQR